MSIEPSIDPSAFPDADKVLRGTDNWLFLQNDANDSVGQYTGKVTLSPSAAEDWLEFFRTILAARAEFGFSFVQLFAPAKESVYEEFYPLRGNRAAIRPIDSVLALVPPEIPFCYPVQELRPRPGRPHAYDKGDHHWNGVGGAIGAITALRMVGCELPDPATLGYREVATFGDLDSKISATPLGTRLYAPRNKDVTLAFDSMIENHGRVVVYINPKAPKRSLMILGDSFSNYIQPMLATCFQRIVRVHGHGLDRQIIGIERPDYLIFQMAERFVVRAPPTITTVSLIQIMRRKLTRMREEDRQKVHAAIAAGLAGPESAWARFLSTALASGDGAHKPVQPD